LKVSVDSAGVNEFAASPVAAKNADAVLCRSIKEPPGRWLNLFLRANRPYAMGELRLVLVHAKVTPAS
jgi:hypothetical protein